MNKKCPYCKSKMEPIIEIDIAIGNYCIKCNHVSITHTIEGLPGEEYAVPCANYDNYDDVDIEDLVLVTLNTRRTIKDFTRKLVSFILLLVP